MAVRQLLAETKPQREGEAMSKEAMKLALEALEVCEQHGYIPVRLTRDSITALREALAEIALERMAENDLKLGLDYTITQTGVGIGKPISDHRLMEGQTDWEAVAADQAMTIGLLKAVQAAQPAQQTIHCKHRLENNGVCPHHNLHCGWPKCNEPAQPAQQELVAWQYRDARDDGTWGAWLGCDKRLAEDKYRQVRPLYTSPPAQRKPLTNDAARKLWSHIEGVTVSEAVMLLSVVRATEAAHGIKGDA